MKIKIYSTSVCPYCVMLKDYLKKRNVEFTDVDVSKDEQAADEMIKKSGQMGVPVAIFISGDGREKVIIGFDKANIDELLKTDN